MAVPNFEELMGDVRKFQQALGQVHSTLTSPQDKDLLGDLMNRIETARQDVEKTYPQAVDAIKKSATDTQANMAQAEDVRAGLEKEIRAKADENAKKAASAPKPAEPRPPSRPPVPDLKTEDNMGAKLRGELLHRFADIPPPHLEEEVDRDVWQDWDWKDD